NKIITTNSSSIVTLSPISLLPNPVISGNSMQLVAGKATFSNLILKNPDLYKLQADDGGDTEAVSSRFKVARDHMVFLAQPKETAAGTPIAFTVAVEDFKNKIIDPSPMHLLTLKNAKTGEVIGTTLGNPTDDNGRLTFSVIVNHPPDTYTTTVTEE